MAVDPEYRLYFYEGANYWAEGGILRSAGPLRAFIAKHSRNGLHSTASWTDSASKTQYRWEYDLGNFVVYGHGLNCSADRARWQFYVYELGKLQGKDLLTPVLVRLATTTLQPRFEGDTAWDYVHAEPPVFDVEPICSLLASLIRRR